MRWLHKQFYEASDVYLGMGVGIILVHWWGIPDQWMGWAFVVLSLVADVSRPDSKRHEQI